MQKLRFLSLFLVHVLILAHVLYFGDETIGSVDFQEFFHSFLRSGTVNSGVVLVVLAFTTTLFFGRFFCGWACHFGAVQELSWMLFDKLGIKPRTINSRAVFVIPLFILVTFYIYPNMMHAVNRPWTGIRVELGVPEIWAFLPGFVIGTMTFLVDGLIIVYFLGRKGFCRFVCPWGAFLKFPNTFSMFKVRKTGDCTLCSECTTGCPVGIDVSYEINKFDMVVNTNCTSCLICTSSCPSNALSYTYKSPIKELSGVSLYSFISDRIYQPMSYSSSRIKDLFFSIRSSDIVFIPLAIFFGLCIDGLYGIGHLLAYGLGVIASLGVTQMLISKRFKDTAIATFVVIFFIFHGSVKYSLYRGDEHLANGEYVNAIYYHEIVIKFFPKTLSRSYEKIIISYDRLGDSEMVEYYLAEAEEKNIRINPQLKYTLDK